MRRPPPPDGSATPGCSNQALDRGETVLLEAGAGDPARRPRHLPFVTSSLRRPPGRVHRIRHPADPPGPDHQDRQAYTPRVGRARSRPSSTTTRVSTCSKTGAEYGTTTGRPRRCGWYDAVIARYAARVSRVTDFVLTKLDVLTGLEQVPVCVAYDVDGTRHDEMPVSQSDFHHAVPIYEYLPGWWRTSLQVRTFEDLPANARAYVETVEAMSGARISAVRVGPVARRATTVVRHDLV